MDSIFCLIEILNFSLFACYFKDDVVLPDVQNQDLLTLATLFHSPLHIKAFAEKQHIVLSLF